MFVESRDWQIYRAVRLKRSTELRIAMIPYE